MKRNSVVLSLLILTGWSSSIRQREWRNDKEKENSEARRLWSEGNDLYNDETISDAEKKFREALTK
jgi:outer membrane protein assembly factor BamD (BamD/ComL family)